MDKMKGTLNTNGGAGGNYNASSIFFNTNLPMQVPSKM